MEDAEELPEAPPEETEEEQLREKTIAEMVEDGDTIDEETQRRIGMTGEQRLLVAASFNSAI